MGISDLPVDERVGLGTPVIYGAAKEDRVFAPLSPISTRRDDPNSFDEELLQTVVDRVPNVLPVREFLPSASAVISLAQEVPVDIGGSEGFIDNLLVTNDGHLVIVETKLYRNPEAVREVVTQTMQYGMAIGQMPLSELEARIRRGRRPALLPGESIRDCVFRIATNDVGVATRLADDFEESLERHLRRGEVLLLVVSDGIRIGVERLTDWLNTQGSSSPLRFGLVELKSFDLGGQRLVIPRAVLKTREVSRHVVVVDIQQPSAEIAVAARVTDEFRSTSGGKLQESRPVKAAPVPLTKATFLQTLRPEDRQAAVRLVDALEALGFDQQGTPATLKFGLSTDDGEFHSLVALDKSGAWVGPLKKDADRLGTDVMLAFRNEANRFAPFFRDDQLKTLVGFGCAGKYKQLEASASELAAFLDTYKVRLLDLLSTGDIG